MSQTVLRGYKVSVDGIYELEQLLRNIKDKLMEKAKEECRILLTREIESLFDSISLNKIQRPQSIYMTACEILSKRIQNASFKQLPIEYNYNISINILTNEDCIFAKVNSNNFIFKEVFDSVPEFEEYSLTDIDILHSSDTKAKRWTELMNEYKEFQPISISLLTGREDFLNDIAPDELVFDTPENRVEVLTRQEMTTRLINMYANHEQIPPHKLTEYIEQALCRLDNAEIASDIYDIRNQLKMIIKPITADVIA